MKRGAWAYIRCVGCAATAFALFSGSAFAQTNSQEKSPQAASAAADSDQAAATFRAYTDLVVIPVTVTDTLNRFVLGLQKEDFHLFEDGVEQNVAHFSGEDAPLSVGVLFDNSGSMAYKLGTSRDAVTQLLNALTKEDEAFLIEFADIAKVSIGFTGHTEEIQSALKNSQAGGLTAMLDAIDAGLREMKKRRIPGKQLWSFLTEGTTAASTLRPRSSRLFAKPTCKSMPWVFSNRSSL